MPAVAAIPLFWGAVGAGAAAGGSIIASKISSGAAKDAAASQSDAATKAAQIQADAANKAAELQAQTASQALDYSRQQSQLSLDQYNQQQQRLQPYRNLGAFALGEAPSAAPPPLTLPNLPSSQTTPTSGQTATGSPSTMTSGATGTATGSDPAAYALSLVKSGVSPQDAATQTNAKFPGAAALYYPQNNTIGLPSAYIAGPTKPGDSGWTLNPRNGGAAAGGATGAASTGQRLPFNPVQVAAGTPITPTGNLQAPQIQPYRTLAQLGGIQ